MIFTHIIFIEIFNMHMYIHIYIYAYYNIKLEDFVSYLCKKTRILTFYDLFISQLNNFFANKTAMVYFSCN